MRHLLIIPTAIASWFAWLVFSHSKFPFDENGRYFDSAEGVIYDQGAILFYVLGAIVLFLPLVIYILARLIGKTITEKEYSTQRQRILNSL